MWVPVKVCCEVNADSSASTYELGILSKAGKLAIEEIFPFEYMLSHMRQSTTE